MARVAGEGGCVPVAAELARGRLVHCGSVGETGLVSCVESDTVAVECAEASQARGVADDGKTRIGGLIMCIPNEFTAETSIGAECAGGAGAGTGFAGRSKLAVELAVGTGRHTGLVVVGKEAGLAGEAETRVGSEAVEAVGGEAGAALGGGGVPILLLGATVDAGT